MRLVRFGSIPFSGVKKLNANSNAEVISVRKLFPGYSINFNDKEQFDFARSYVLYVIRHKKIDSYVNKVNSSSRISSTLLSVKVVFKTLLSFYDQI